MAAKPKHKTPSKTAVAAPSGKTVVASMQAMAKQMNAKVASSSKSSSGAKGK
jgi:hypothetical protein